MEELQEEATPPKKKKKSEWAELFSPRTIVATCALFVSLSSLMLTVWQMRENRKAQYASVLPYITCGFYKAGYDARDSTGYFKMAVCNDGIGPGFVHWIRIMVDDKVYDGNQFARAMHDLGDLTPGQELNFSYASIPPMRLISAGEDLDWFEPEGDNKTIGHIVRNAWNNPYGKEKPFDMKICYSDVYGRKWVFNYADYNIKPCDECPDIPVTDK
jgi:hypothetical protein